MKESNIQITVEVYTSERESILDPVTWDFDSLTITNVGIGGLSFTENELSILVESICQIKPKYENCWYCIILERKSTNNGLSMPPDERYELIEIKKIS